MTLAPAPLMPGHSPLPTPGERPADRRALRMGALVGSVTLLVALVVGQWGLTRLVFFAPGLLARAATNQGASQSALFQGFTYLWTKNDQAQYDKAGFQSPASLQNMQSEAHDFNMNTVVIPVIGDMADRNSSTIYWRASDNFAELDTLPDLDYAKAIDDARKAGLEPILELELKQYDPTKTPDRRPLYIGENWYGLRADSSLFINGGSESVGQLEHTWVDNYTAFAVHFAALAKTKDVKYLIIGDGLGNLTSDSTNSSAQNDPTARSVPPGDTFNAGACTGRHDCEWRHIIHAIQGLSYSTYIGNHPQTGANYSGKLIYAASYAPPDAAGSGPGEFEAIQWWDAVDAIGVDAYFPLTNSTDLQTADLQAAWHGKGQELAGQNDIYSRLQTVSDKFHKEVLFTGAGYESVPAANNVPAYKGGDSVDENEQLTDMQALLLTFTGTPWWIGAIWYYDQPQVPRSAQFNWQKGTQWAGDNLHGNKPNDTKKAGQWLSTYYQTMPVPCLC